MPRIDPPVRSGEARLGERPAVRAKLRARLRRQAPRGVELEAVETCRRPLPPRGGLRSSMAVAFSALGVVLAISLLTDFLDGEPQGEPCLSHEDCETGLCLVHLFPDARYCSRDCDRSSQCGVGLSCVDAESLPDTQRGVGALGPTSAATNGRPAPSPSVCARSPR